MESLGVGRASHSTLPPTLSVMLMMPEQQKHCSIVQYILIKYLALEEVEVMEIFRRLIAQFWDQALSRIVCLPAIKSSRKDEKKWKIRNTVTVLEPTLQMKTFARFETFLKMIDYPKLQNR